MAYRAWICEGCRTGNLSRSDVWDCPGCGKECCEHCFDRYGHCKTCAAGKTDEALRLAANERDFDFDPPETAMQPGAASQERTE